ncbi:MAG: tetratricopeptide repeat protein [Candidatus Gastranaerophilales bacterium]|nr:tetratricopeptide repeat protein [Candidatus Gastranaerophilales bacterium]
MDKKEINQQEKEQAQQESENIQPSRLDFIRELISDCRYDDAMELLGIAMDDEPDNVDYNYELARIFMEMGNYASAVSNLELVLEKTQSSLLYFMLGEAYQADEQLDKAIGAYLKANALNENFPFAYKKLGMLFMARGDMDDAREYFEDYIKLDIAEDEKDSVRKILERI